MIFTYYVNPFSFTVKSGKCNPYRRQNLISLVAVVRNLSWRAVRVANREDVGRKGGGGGVVKA